jgi:hypothetical protein
LLAHAKASQASYMHLKAIQIHGYLKKMGGVVWGLAG